MTQEFALRARLMSFACGESRNGQSGIKSFLDEKNRKGKHQSIISIILLVHIYAFLKLIKIANWHIVLKKSRNVESAHL